ncbi:transposase [Nitrosomonas communis]|uniref:Transposase n=1 Tax=Nitrosomonas communis TaxID=44574 RepID=A0A1H2U580_9PROT|nr:transposase [Nitrosomonas communis]SDW51325.1 transposase [Nitrosomonas communis]
MAQEKPKVYTAEFRESSVKLAIESDKPVAQTAREIGVNENTLHSWISQYSRLVDNIKAVRTDDPLYEELKPLEREVARLTEERDLLKKAAAYFAKEQQ